MAEPSQPGKVRVFGPGVESVVRGQPTQFTVDCKLAGQGEVDLRRQIVFLNFLFPKDNSPICKLVYALETN